MNDAAIESVPLYTHNDRIAKGLAALGIGPDDPIKPEQAFTLDQMNYHGTDAIKAAAVTLKLGPASRVLDVGSGFGGPARYLAHTTGCHVTALELQPELHQIAVDLTRRTGLADRVTQRCGDALTQPLPDAAFDAVVSWLTILHIPDRPRLFARFARLLRPGGAAYVEDLCMRAPFAPQDLSDLREFVYGVSVTSIEDYIEDFRAAGFTEIVATDLTGDWAPFAQTRLAEFRDNRAAYARERGEGAYADQEKFFAVIAGLYNVGSLGGVRVLARKP